jgi:hypothetical protein
MRISEQVNSALRFFDRLTIRAAKLEGILDIAEGSA